MLRQLHEPTDITGGKATSSLRPFRRPGPTSRALWNRLIVANQAGAPLSWDLVRTPSALPERAGLVTSDAERADDSQCRPTACCECAEDERRPASEAGQQRHRPHTQEKH